MTETGGARSLPIAGYAHRLAVADPQHIWLALDRSTLYGSADAGRSWSPAPGVTNPDDSPVGPVVFADPLHGWVAAPLHTIYRTVDGGRHWLKTLVR